MYQTTQFSNIYLFRLTNKFEIKRYLNQGDLLWKLLFNLVLENVIGNIRMHRIRASVGTMQFLKQKDRIGFIPVYDPWGRCISRNKKQGRAHRNNKTCGESCKEIGIRSKTTQNKIHVLENQWGESEQLGDKNGRWSDLDILTISKKQRGEIEQNHKRLIIAQISKVKMLNKIVKNRLIAWEKRREEKIYKGKNMTEMWKRRTNWGNSYRLYPHDFCFGFLESLFPRFVEGTAS